MDRLVNLGFDIHRSTGSRYTILGAVGSRIADVRELELLEYLVRHHDEIVTREMLAREVWKEPTLLTNVIDVYVRMLRKKIERPGLRPLIHTIRGVGFMLREGEP